MYIWLPVDKEDEKYAKIQPQEDAVKWALVEFDAGEIESVNFYENRNDFGDEWVDFVILKNKYETYIDFMNEGMMCLCVREEETIEDIMTAFKFKELDEMGL